MIISVIVFISLLLIVIGAILYQETFYCKKRKMIKWGYEYIKKYNVWVHKDCKMMCSDVSIKECNSWPAKHSPSPRKTWIYYQTNYENKSDLDNVYRVIGGFENNVIKLNEVK